MCQAGKMAPRRVADKFLCFVCHNSLLIFLVSYGRGRDQTMVEQALMQPPKLNNKVSVSTQNPVLDY